MKQISCAYLHVGTCRVETTFNYICVPQVELGFNGIFVFDLQSMMPIMNDFAEVETCVEVRNTME